MDLARPSQPYLQKLSALLIVLQKSHFLLLASSLNFGSKIVIASQRQWWFSFVVQMRKSFFMKLVF